MKIEATSTGSGKNRDSFDLSGEQNLPFCHLFPEPGKQLPL